MLEAALATGFAAYMNSALTGGSSAFSRISPSRDAWSERAGRVLRSSRGAAGQLRPKKPRVSEKTTPPG
jgi:hypothetical protein